MKIWLIVGIALVLIGLILFVVVMTLNNWDFTRLTTVKYVTNTYKISEAFQNLALETATADICFAKSDDGSCKVVCFESEREKHTVAVQDNTLRIRLTDERKWYDYIGINIGSPKITVYLPGEEYGAVTIKESTGDVEISRDFRFERVDIAVSTGDIKNYASVSGDVKIRTSTGGINIENITAGSLDLRVSTGMVNVSSVDCEGNIQIRVSTGKTNMTDVICKGVVSTGSTGDISLKNVIAAEQFSIERDTGDVKMESCDAGEIFVKTSTGDVIGSLLSEKIVFAQTDTGNVNVPKSVTGGKCEITTDTGNIKIEF